MTKRSRGSRNVKKTLATELFSKLVKTCMTRNDVIGDTLPGD